MNVFTRFIQTIMPLASLGFVLTTVSTIFAGPLSIGIVTKPQLFSAMSFVACFIIIITLFFFIDSLRLAKRFLKDDSNQIDVAALWKSLPVKSSILTGSAVIALVVLSLDGNANLVEVYRTHTFVWYDRVLWNIEEPVFRAVATSNLLPMEFWEAIYHLMWIYVMVVMAALVKGGRTESYMAFAIAIVLSFYCRTFIAMIFPIAGPQYYRPELFAYLAGSEIKLLQDFLGKYQAGKILQNGLYYGTVAMPSLHVAMTAMATWFVARHWTPWLWLAIPWAVLIWLSTVVLAWHYVLDGVAAIALACLCIVCAKAIIKCSGRLALRLWRFDAPASCASIAKP